MNTLNSVSKKSGAEHVEHLGRIPQKGSYLVVSLRCFWKFRKDTIS